MFAIALCTSYFSRAKINKKNFGLPTLRFGPLYFECSGAGTDVVFLVLSYFPEKIEVFWWENRVFTAAYTRLRLSPTIFRSTVLSLKISCVYSIEFLTLTKRHMNESDFCSALGVSNFCLLFWLDSYQTFAVSSGRASVIKVFQLNLAKIRWGVRQHVLATFKQSPTSQSIDQPISVLAERVKAPFFRRSATVWSRLRDLSSTLTLIGHVVASLDKALYDDYFCLVASHKQQIKW